MTTLPSPTPTGTGRTARTGARPGPVARLLGRLIRGYQWAMAGRVSPCRYVPSCSSYALESLEVHGAARGTWLAIRRLGRCHPWGGHGWDPVPDPKGR